ncbi:Beta-glucuronosyltransferase [Quillaja saponaria]|uniref:Beta-glucuronosyltransferase n=1 Tax=Quillaja saponaria TaxID=32244 RepID=A0AAD7PBG1_QUISA|nr:Beta-glucuronosyltransferase [Quillaja saponaria]
MIKLGPLNMEKKWLFSLAVTSLICICLIATSSNMGNVSSLHIHSFFFFLPSRSSTNQTTPIFAEEKISEPPTPLPGPAIPRFAYLISGSKGDLEKLWRTLHALYHPLNHYVVHLDLESPPEERLELASRIERHPIFTEVGNVFMITKANMVTYRGPTMVANTLHACAILLKRSKTWDWFINLSASDYPLVTQDDLLYTFSGLDKSLNFIESFQPARLEGGQKSNAFNDRPWTLHDDQIRHLLGHSSKNFANSFQTIYWFSMDENFAKTAVNSDLHYISWDFPPRQHPHTLSLNDTDKMIASNAAFARKFRQDDPVLDKIDKELLRRRKGRFTPGGWCLGSSKCTKVGDVTKLKPGPGAQRLRLLVARLTLQARFGTNQCK